MSECSKVVVNLLVTLIHVVVYLKLISLCLYVFFFVKVNLLVTLLCGRTVVPYEAKVQ